MVVGLVFATWHMPLIFLAPAQVGFPTGNLLLFFPLFYGTVIAASFFFGYMRIYTGSTWPASIAHAVHNSAWGVLESLTLITASPVLVSVYLVGDFGILILIGTVIGAVWVGHRFKRGMDEAQAGAEVPRVDPAPPRPPRPRGRHIASRSIFNSDQKRYGVPTRDAVPSLRGGCVGG